MALQLILPPRLISAPGIFTAMAPCWPIDQQNHHMPEKAQAQMRAARQEHPLLGMLLA
eukprot:COSAG06_NODE_2143_length_7484_cov_6.113067_4_plen_58_part_00